MASGFIKLIASLARSDAYIDSDVSAISKIQNCTRVIDMSAKSQSRIRTGSFDMHVAQL